MNAEIKEQWLNALRSGDYAQGTGGLRTVDGTYCCLGVLTDLAVKRGVLGWAERREGTQYLDVVVDGESHVYGTLPPVVADWAGLGDAQNPEVACELGAGLLPLLNGKYTLASVNDKGKNFAEIADLIEEQL